MNNIEWGNFKSIITNGIHVCMSIADFTDILLHYEEANALGFDPVTEKEILRTGLYGSFLAGTVVVCVSKDTPSGHIKFAAPESKPIDNKSSEWSIPIPIKQTSSLDEMKRLVGLSAFW